MRCFFRMLFCLLSLSLPRYASSFSNRIRVPTGGWCSPTTTSSSLPPTPQPLLNATPSVIAECSRLRGELVRHLHSTLHPRGAGAGHNFEQAYREGGMTPTSQGATNLDQFAFLVSLVASKQSAVGQRVINVCETGFNWGTSSLAWLCASPMTRVFSFDLPLGYRTSTLGGRPYIHQSRAWLNARFPNRLILTLGDSFKTVPTFVRQRRGQMRCDIVFADGGHDAANAFTDMRSFQCLAERGAFLLADDCDLRPPGSRGKPGVHVAYSRMREQGLLEHRSVHNFSHRLCCLGEYGQPRA
ncbi:MAG: hypothetical protein SGPRY_006659 [Prymnesium sp.]